MMNPLKTVLYFCTLPVLLSAGIAEEDYKVEELPFYKIGQLEKEKLYFNTAKGFSAAKSALEASKYITDTSPVEVAEFTKAYRQYHQKRTGAITDDLIVFGKGGNQFAHITMETRSGNQSVIQMVWEKDFMEPKVDWRATYGCSETSWEEFFEIKPQIPTVMRVRFAFSDYYNFHYTDDKTWACLKCYHPFLKKELFAYVKWDEPHFKDQFLLLQGKGHIDVVAELFYPEEIKDWKQVEISKVLNNTWYNKDYDNDLNN